MCVFNIFCCGKIFGVESKVKVYFSGIDFLFDVSVDCKYRVGDISVMVCMIYMLIY